MDSSGTSGVESAPGVKLNAILQGAYHDWLAIVLEVLELKKQCKELRIRNHELQLRLYSAELRLANAPR